MKITKPAIVLTMKEMEILESAAFLCKKIGEAIEPISGIDETIKQITYDTYSALDYFNSIVLEDDTFDLTDDDEEDEEEAVESENDSLKEAKDFLNYLTELFKNDDRES